MSLLSNCDENPRTEQYDMHHQYHAGDAVESLVMELFSSKVESFRTCTGNVGMNLFKGILPTYEPFTFYKVASALTLIDCIIKLASRKFCFTPTSKFNPLQDNSVHCTPDSRDAFTNLRKSSKPG